MYKNHSPYRDYAPESDPHEPTNLPDGLEDKCHRLFEHVETWSVQSGATKYVYPKTEDGYHDYPLMLDEMGFEAGAIIDYRDTRMVVIERTDVGVNWGETYDVDRGGVTVAIWDGPRSENTRTFTPAGSSPKSLWKAFIYGELERVGNVFDV